MEAMSYGLPALVSGYTAQPEVVEKWIGFAADRYRHSRKA